MKTDLVVTMDEYLNETRPVSRRVDPPAAGARHVTITAADDARLANQSHSYSCDRWGHPYDDSSNRHSLRKPQKVAAPPLGPNPSAVR